MVNKSFERKNISLERKQAGRQKNNIEKQNILWLDIKKLKD